MDHGDLDLFYPLVIKYGVLEDGPSVIFLAILTSIQLGHCPAMFDDIRGYSNLYVSSCVWNDQPTTRHRHVLLQWSQVLHSKWKSRTSREKDLFKAGDSQSLPGSAD